MDVADGAELRVGEIRALRTFRVASGGQLYPLFSPTPWVPGVNTATCNSSRQDHDDSDVPAPSCTCGFHAYGSAGAAAEEPRSEHVLAVVACWGPVIAGTRGIRAAYARIEALWLSPTVPAPLVGEVAALHRNTSIYRDRAAMLEEHPLTVLECYDPAVKGAWALGTGWRMVLAVVLLVSLVPLPQLPTRDPIVAVVAVGVATLAALVVVRGAAGRDRSARRQAFLVVVGLLWLLAPFGGVVGSVAIRVPMVLVLSMLELHRWRVRIQAARFPCPLP